LAINAFDVVKKVGDTHRGGNSSSNWPKSECPRSEVLLDVREVTAVEGPKPVY